MGKAHWHKHRARAEGSGGADAMDGLEAWYMTMPPVTRGYLTAAFLTTLACNLDLISPYHLYFNYGLILKGQVWRVATNFFFFGHFGLDFFFHIYFLMRYSRSLEETYFRNETSGFFYLLLFGATLMSAAAPFFNLLFLGHSLAFMLVYIWGQRNRDVRMSFLGLFTFNAPYLPWVLLGFAYMLNGNPWVDLMGIAAGHIYFFLVDVYPDISGRRLLATPTVLKWAFGELDGGVRQ